MDERDRDGALADRGGDALDVAAANVADGEDAGQAGFEQIRRRAAAARRRAARSSGERSGPVLMNPLASSATQPSSQPVFGTAPVIMNTCRMSRVSTLPVRLSRHANALEMRVAFERDDLGPRAQRDRRDCLRCGGSR